ncbi:probable inactive peptidyl-prolyl cis-trans isomerase-like 6 [Diprion similis]|uniref:probable inactive peptidyl-prolyl cis-trans isomerase-like 6 n=1 Tax=Diprion similis TaxID=362088 RepID=UPI001EF80786|nr:probable inactive peptidyl-prolyl cis-trans isomerase-like 6 [Diprion similis]
MARHTIFGRCSKTERVASSLGEEPFVKDRFLNRPEVPYIAIKLAGLLTTIDFQKAQLIANKLHDHLPFRFSKPEIRAMLQVDWYEYMQKMKPRIGDRMWLSNSQVMVFLNDEYIGNDKDFEDYISESYVFRLPTKGGYYQDLITQQFQQYIEDSGRDYVYFTFTINNQTIGSFLFMLFSDLLPRTCKNFLDLCIGDQGHTKDGTHLHYKNTIVHRIVKNGWLQCGDIELIRGGGGTATNGAVIPDESYCVPHNRRGVLSMANNGKDSNGSQFVISLKANPWMDYYYVAFGQLVDGVETLKKIEQVPTLFEKPLRRIVISRCGQYFFGEEPDMEAGPDAFVKHASELLTPMPEGECPGPCPYIYPGYPGIDPWLDNVADKLDDRDTISLLMAERYLSGLYTLATDYLPGTDMLLPERQKVSPATEVNIDMNQVCPGYETGESAEFSFDFATSSDEEKLALICGVGKEIVARALNACDDEANLERMSMDGVGTAQWILELACEVASAALARVEPIKSRELHEQEDCQKVFLSEEVKKITEGLVTPDGMSLVEEILKEALLHAVEVGKDPEDSEIASEAMMGDE